jgi:basic membrane protein A
MKLNRLAIPLAIAASAIVLTACSTTPSSAPSDSESGSSDSAPKVAVILGGLANDGGFNQYVADAANALADSGDITVTFRESVTTATDSEPIMRQYAADGYDLIIGWGLGFSDSVFKVAEEDPETNFVATGGEDILEQATDNVETWTFSSQQSGYLAGWVAGKSGATTVGVVDGELAAFNETTYKYVSYGLAQTNPDVTELKPIFTGSWEDPTLANQAAKAQIAAGADLIITGAEGYTSGVLSAAKQAGVATLGASLTSSSDAADVNIGFVKLNFLPALTSIVENVVADDFAGKSFIATIDNGGLIFADLNPVAAAPGVTDELATQIEELGKQIVDGTVVIPDTLP